MVGARGATFASAYRFIERAGIFTDKDYRPKKTKTKNVNKKEHQALLGAFLRFINSQHKKAGYGEYKLNLGSFGSCHPVSCEEIDSITNLDLYRITRVCDLYDSWGWPSLCVELGELLRRHYGPFMGYDNVRDYFYHINLYSSQDDAASVYPRTIHAVQDEYINKVKEKYRLSSYYEKTNVKKAILFNRLWICPDNNQFFYDILTRKETARAHMCHLNSLLFTRSYRIPSTHSGVDFFDQMNTIFQGALAEFNEKKATDGFYMKAAIHDTPLSPKPMNNYNNFIITIQIFKDTYIDENCEFKPLFEDGILLPEAQEYMDNNLY